ncbi:UNVERIFIED_CONTAM: putative ribonuclease H protein [Sesamum radiatum]|uniref:Ribonuclease H protein n=1 Tax=Sesamum radiatum TaxID=300843 RepID=A0AAW2THY4_SESRA
MCNIGFLCLHDERIPVWLSPTGKGYPARRSFSPYLFILCAEALSCLLQACEVDGRISGVAVARSAPKVSHLLFVDDTLIFCQATKEALSCVRAVVDMYRKALGQQVNLQKSSIVFSRNTNTTTRDELAAILGVRIDTIHEKYLGLPYVVGRRKKDLFHCLRDRVWRKVDGWKEKTLSQAGKEILIKSIIQAIPSFSMSCSKIPDSLLKEIDSTSSNFFWNNSEQNKIHWIAWNKMCRSKKKGAWASVIYVLSTSYVGKARLAHPSETEFASQSDIEIQAEIHRRISRFWHYTKSGTFSVKSAYHVTTSLLSQYNSSKSGQSSSWSRAWAGIWSARVPNKIKVFLWRACKEAIPTTANLIRRKCVVDENCTSCGAPLENSKHVFLDCSFARQTWALADIPNSVISQWEQDMEGWIVKGPCWQMCGMAFFDSLGVTNPEHGEALAALLAIDLCHQQSWNSCIIEGDCIQVIQNLKTPTVDSSVIAPIIFDGRSIARKVPNILFCYVKRTANQAAHALAKAALSPQVDNYPPTHLFNIIRADAQK